MINRHFDEENHILEDEISRYERFWKAVLKGIQERPSEVIGKQVNKALSAFSQSIVSEQPHEKSLHFLQILRTLGLANFRSSMHPGETFEVELMEKTIEITGVSTTAYMDADMWLNVFFSAVTLRDIDAVNELCQIPESVHQNSNLQADAFDLAFVKAMKGLFNPNINIGQLLVDAMEASDPGGISPSRLDYIDQILYPQLPLYRCILSSDQAEFNEKLQEAVLKHKQYWGQGERQFNSEGWIALPLIGAAAIAFDNKQFNMTFETDYIPTWLVRSEFS